MSRKFTAPLAAALLLGTSFGGLAQDGNRPATIDSDALNGLDVITVVGQQTSTDDVAGSITFIGPEALALQNYSDINRVLRAAPGVNIQEEDGFGLRPNIGIRGSGADRSSKVVIMEDGVLMSPAAYSAPAAYYFPSTGRMNAVELSKGPATIKYGPNTTAGALQLFSTPIPKETAAHLSLNISDLGTQRVHGWAGTTFDAGKFDAGILVETFQNQSDGFKDIDGSTDGNDTGFEISDYIVKLGASTKDGRQSLQLKIQSSDQVSDETYLGLSQADFDAKPERRYNASANDRFVSDHQTYQLTHNIDLGDAFKLTTIAYRTEFARNWRKLDRFDNSELSESDACDTLDEILRDTDACDAEFEVLVGAPGFTSPDDVLQLRANNREYYTKGIQTALGGTVALGEFNHNLTASVRYHQDGVDRFQDQDGYRIENGGLVLTTDNAPGTQANRLSSADALSAYVEDRVDFGDLSVTAGLRVEDVSTEQRRWNTPDRDLTPDSTRENNYTEWLPALAAKYDLTEQLTVLGGVHKGFSAPSVSSRETVSPERSTIWEGGMRWRGQDGLFVDAIGFYNDYSNLVGVCTNSSAATECDAGEGFNGGEVDVYGLELTASQVLNTGAFEVPLGLTYTWTESEFKTSFEDSFFGDVVAGDTLPYVPTHQLTLNAGLHAERWGVDGVMNAVSETRNIAGSGDIPAAEEIDARTLFDISGYYDLRKGVRLKLKVENLFDETYLAARRPYGLRPGKPREVFAGLSLDF